MYDKIHYKKKKTKTLFLNCSLHDWDIEKENCSISSYSIFLNGNILEYITEEEEKNFF